MKTCMFLGAESLRPPFAERPSAESEISAYEKAHAATATMLRPRRHQKLLERRPIALFSPKDMEVLGLSLRCRANAFGIKNRI